MIAIRFFVILVFVILYLPIFYVIAASFIDDGFTLKWYEQLFQNRIIVTAFYNSLTVALASTLLSVILGTLAAYSFVRYDMRAESVFYTPIIIPEITEALSLLLFYNLLDFPLGFYSVFLGHTAFNIAFVYVIVRARLEGFQKSLEDASLTLGANEFQTFVKVTLPLSMPGIIASTLIAFTLSWDNFIKTIFTTGPGFQTLPLIIWAQAARGAVNPSLNALTSIMLIVSLIMSYFYVKLSRK